MHTHHTRRNQMLPCKQARGGTRLYSVSSTSGTQMKKCGGHRVRSSLKRVMFVYTCAGKGKSCDSHQILTLVACK